jgi:hypothetical protein
VDAAPLVEIGEVFKNTKDNILVITTSKAELVLRKHWKRIQQSNDWQATLLFLIPIFLALPTTEFATRFGVNKYVWQSLFFITVGMCVLWLVVQVVRRLHGGLMDAKMVVGLLLEDREPITASSAPAVPHAASDTAHATDPAHTGNHHPPLPSPPPPSHLEQRTESAATSAGTPERTLPGEAALNGVRPGERIPELSAGTHVRHRNFGVGTVEGVLPGPPRLLLVRFTDPDVGTKRLREDLAPLWHLGDED